MSSKIQYDLEGKVKSNIEGTPCEHQQRLLMYLDNYDLSIVPDDCDPDDESAQGTTNKQYIHCSKCGVGISVVMTHENLRLLR